MTTVFNIKGMSCEHCVKAVTKAVAALQGVKNVAVELSSNTATVDYDPDIASAASITAAIEEEGYGVGA